MEKYPQNCEKSLPGSVGSVCLQVHSMRLTSSTEQVLLLQHRRQVLGARQPDGARVSPPKNGGKSPKKWEGHGGSHADFMRFYGILWAGSEGKSILGFISPSEKYEKSSLFDGGELEFSPI